MSEAIAQSALDQLFFNARTHNGWTDTPIAEATIHALYDALRYAPTAFNLSPARFVFVTSDEGRKTLADAAMSSNGAKILEAPCTVIIGYDVNFTAHADTLFPAYADGIRAMYADADAAETFAFRNGTLQVGYLILAARALGLDTGPMSGFDHAAVDAAFFAGTTTKSNVICSIGYGNGEKMYPRNPRLAFDQAARIA